MVNSPPLNINNVNQFSTNTLTSPYYTNSIFIKMTPPISLMNLLYLELIFALCNLTVSPNSEIPQFNAELGLTKVFPAVLLDLASCLIDISGFCRCAI